MMNPSTIGSSVVTVHFMLFGVMSHARPCTCKVLTIVDEVYDFGNNTIGLETDDDAAEAIIAAHNGNTIAPQPTISEKLASVGLSIDDLKSALGL